MYNLFSKCIFGFPRLQYLPSQHCFHVNDPSFGSKYFTPFIAVYLCKSIPDINRVSWLFEIKHKFKTPFNIYRKCNALLQICTKSFRDLHFLWSPLTIGSSLFWNITRYSFSYHPRVLSLFYLDKLKCESQHPLNFHKPSFPDWERSQSSCHYWGIGIIERDPTLQQHKHLQTEYRQSPYISPLLSRDI